MGSVLPEIRCAQRKGVIEELIKGTAAQLQILFGKPTGDHDGPVVKLLTSFTVSLSHVLLSSSSQDCECAVSQIPNQVGSPIGDQRSVDPGESCKRPAAKDLRGCCKRRNTSEMRMEVSATNEDAHACRKYGQKEILEAPFPMNGAISGGVTRATPECINALHRLPRKQKSQSAIELHKESLAVGQSRSYSLNSPSQNPLLEARLLSSSKTITTQDLDSYDSRSFKNDVPSGESISHNGRDYTLEFTTDQIFESREDMLAWVRKVGLENGIVVVIKKSANLKGAKLPKCILGCERGGKYKLPRYLVEGQSLQRNTGTKKCDCPFEVRGKPIPPDGVMWGLRVSCGFHNHKPAEHFEGHEYPSRLKPMEKQFVIDMASSTTPREILSILKEKDPSNTTGIRSIYNAISKNKEAKRGGLISIIV